MTRINVVPVEELSDQHLIREYQELPRVIKGKFDTSNAADKYCLGKGHIKFCKKHSCFTISRYDDLCNEMVFRGFKVNYPYIKLFAFYANHTETKDTYCYIPTPIDLELNQQRLKEKYNLKPEWYKWTKRNKPDYLEDKQ